MNSFITTLLLVWNTAAQLYSSTRLRNRFYQNNPDLLGNSCARDNEKQRRASPRQDEKSDKLQSISTIQTEIITVHRRGIHFTKCKTEQSCNRTAWCIGAVHHGERVNSPCSWCLIQNKAELKWNLWWSPSGNVGQKCATHELHHNLSAGCGDGGGPVRDRVLIQSCWGRGAAADRSETQKDRKGERFHHLPGGTSREPV